MNRREFLRFTHAHDEPTAELSCAQLYMRMVDAQRVNEPSADGDIWDGEPPAVFESSTVEQLFTDLERDLRDIRIVRVMDANWIESSGDLKRRLEAVLDAFRVRGGRVELASPVSPSSPGQ